MSVEVDFGRWGLIALAPGQSVRWWFTWIFDGGYWTRMSAVAENWSPVGGLVQISEEGSNPGTMWVTWTNVGSDYVYFEPTAAVLPSRF